MFLKQLVISFWVGLIEQLLTVDYMFEKELNEQRAGEKAIERSIVPTRQTESIGDTTARVFKEFSTEVFREGSMREKETFFDD